MTRDGNELELGLIPNKSVACTLSSINTNHLIKNTSRDHLHQLLDDKVSHKDQPYEKVLLKTGTNLYFSLPVRCSILFSPFSCMRGTELMQISVHF